MAIQPIGTNHKAANLAILSYQVDLHSTYSVGVSTMESDRCKNEEMLL